LLFACPHCSLALERTNSGAQCANGHAFDRAREGYLNLLVGGRIAPSTESGDTKESLAARRRFLSAGWYAPIAEALAEAVGNIDGVVLDSGCGEGYYLSHVSASRKYGLDISKRAVQMASKLLPTAEFVVASAYRLPVLEQSCDVVFSVFAPRPIEEFQRVLRPGGKWVTVAPGPNHLKEMRPVRGTDAAMRAIERDFRRAEAPQQADSSRRVSFQLDLTPDAARDLFSMTPLVWQSDPSHELVQHVSVDVWVSKRTT